MLHFPWASLIAVCARSERANRAYVDAHAALFALEVVAKIRNNGGTRSAIVNSQSGDVHALIAHTHAAVAENAARTVEVDHRRPLLLVAMVLEINKLRLGGAI